MNFDKRHYTMIYKMLIIPIVQAMGSLSDFIWGKIFFLLIVFLGAAQFQWEILSTPAIWWQGLAVLVFLDWITGIVRSIYKGSFAIRYVADKWFQTFGYIVTGVAAAVMANVFENILSFIQYFVYLSFFIKEGLSIAQNVGLRAYLVKVYRAIYPKGRGANIFKVLTDTDQQDKETDMTYEGN